MTTSGTYQSLNDLTVIIIDAISKAVKDNAPRLIKKEVDAAVKKAKREAGIVASKDEIDDEVTSRIDALIAKEREAILGKVHEAINDCEAGLKRAFGQCPTVEGAIDITMLGEEAAEFLYKYNTGMYKERVPQDALDLLSDVAEAADGLDNVLDEVIAELRCLKGVEYDN